MPEESMIDLDEERGLDTTFDGLDGLGLLYLQQVRRLLEIVPRSSERVRRRWEQMCRAVGAGRLEQVHLLRPEFQRYVDVQLQHLERARRSADTAAALCGEALIEGRELPRLIAELKQFRDSVVGSWKTLEDLEELAAAHFPLPASRLEMLCRNHPPPPSWYDEEGKPF